jgi:uncharacterized membrane protein YkoI
MKRTSIFLFAILLLTTSVFAANSKVTEKVKESSLQKLAKVSPDSAITLAFQKAPGKIVESDLEVENGLLVYSYDIQSKEDKIIEVQIDAISGSVVSTKEETPANEKAEKSETNLGKGEKGENEKMEARKEKEGKEGEEAEEKANESVERSEWVGSISVKGNIALAALAKINDAQADSAAMKLVAGKIILTKLANEDGYLVYKVVLDVNGTNYKALVDAGNARVLEIEAENK